jgi:hypothetical protein
LHRIFADPAAVKPWARVRVGIAQTWSLKTERSLDHRNMPEISTA